MELTVPRIGLAEVEISFMSPLLARKRSRYARLHMDKSISIVQDEKKTRDRFWYVWRVHQ